MVKRDKNSYKLKAPGIIAFLQTDRRKTNLSSVNTKFSSKSIIESKDIKTTTENHDVLVAEEILNSPILIDFKEDIKQIIHTIDDLDFLNRLFITIKICEDYALSFETLDQCTSKHGKDRSTFYKWTIKSELIKSIYKVGKLTVME